MSETIRVRRARPEEAALLTELTISSKAHWPYDAAFLAVVRHELEFQPSKYLPDFHVYVLEEKQTVLGFCGLIRVDEARMELRDLFLDPNYIGKGQGKRLWNFAVEHARGLGFRTLILTADPYAEPFYLHQGAVRIGETAGISVNTILRLHTLDTFVQLVGVAHPKPTFPPSETVSVNTSAFLGACEVKLPTSGLLPSYFHLAPYSLTIYNRYCR